MAKLRLQKPIKTDNPYVKRGHGSWKGVISQLFDDNALPIYRESGKKGHGAIDITYRGLQDHPPVYAAHDGIILENVKDKYGGLGVRLVTDKKYEYKGKSYYFWTIYWHLLSFQRQEGDKVKAGDIIGIGDSTGYSTGPHLHFGLKPLIKKGTRFVSAFPNNGFKGYIDPLPFITSMYKFVRVQGTQDQYAVNEFDEAFRIPDGETKQFAVSFTRAQPQEEIVQDLKKFKIIEDMPSKRIYEERRQQFEADKDVFEKA